MPVRLKSPNSGYPKGGWRFSEPHTGKLFDGEFSDLNHLTKEVIVHRQGNPEIYKPEDTINFNPAAVLQEIVVQLCASQPTICEDDARPGLPYPAPPEPERVEVRQFPGKACPKCGSNDFTPIRCATCGGGRISGWKCVGCGLES